MTEYTFPYYENGRRYHHVVEAVNDKEAFAELFKFISEKPGLRLLTTSPIVAGKRKIPSPIAPAVSA